MILTRLYELAVRKQLLDDPAFESQAVPFTIEIDEDGTFLGLSGQKPTAPKKGEARIERRLSVPCAHGNTATQGFARYFADTLPRVLPIQLDAAKQGKADRSRVTFWEQVDLAAESTNDPALRAIQSFGRNLSTDAALCDRVRAEVDHKNCGENDRITFAFHPDGGRPILERPIIRKWYSELYKQLMVAKQDAVEVGFCTITGEIVPMPKTHSIKLNGIPGGLPTGVSIVSFDKSAFQHYGLDGAANAAIGYDAAEGYARGFQWLQSNKDHRIVNGSTLFLFWTRNDESTDFMTMGLNEASPEQVKHLIEMPKKGNSTDAISDDEEFYFLAITGNSARAVIRDYLECKLTVVRENLAKWFNQLSIADTSKACQGHPNAAYSLWLLSTMTASEQDRVAPDVRSRLMHSAIAGNGVSDSVLVACLNRLRADGSAGFHPARMALIKLILLRKEIAVSESLNPDEQNPAYLYGRLLSVFEQIQFTALGAVNANVVDKFYGTFSAAPATVFSRLVANAQNHLRKMRGDKPGAYVNLDRRISEIIGMLGATPPPSVFSLQDQGRFALGYYHEKAARFIEIAERKAEKL